jgi:O-acetyl-ADP-ribose deacetylase (regulator of RNase III)
MHGGGLAKAIATAGGPAISKESAHWIKLKGEVPTGDLAVTSGGQLPFRYIFHAVGNHFFHSLQLLHQVHSCGYHTYVAKHAPPLTITCTFTCGYNMYVT